VAKDSQGTWIATDEVLIQVVGDLWMFYTSADGLPADRVRKVAPDDREVWAATPRGLGRMDRSARRWETLTAPDPLPSNNVYSVAVDDRYAWVGTDRGAARYDKVSRSWTRVTNSSGPGKRIVYDILSLGRQVWFATNQGMFTFDRVTGQWRQLGIQEGLDLGDVFEIDQVGESLWFFCRQGLARFDLRTRAVSTFTKDQGLPSPQITSFASVAGEIWIGTPEKMVVYSPSSDAISDFIYARGMPKGAVTGIEVALPYVWVSTTEGLGVFNTLQKVWEEKRKEDGLASNHIEGMTLTGSILVLLQPGMYQGYKIQQDDWQKFSIADVWAGRLGSAAEPSRVKFNLELTLSGEGNYTKSGGSGSGWDGPSQLIPDLRLGIGTELEEGRTLDASVRLDAGDITTGGIREYDAELRFQGNADDNLKQLLISDELPLRGSENEHDLLDDAWLEGIGVIHKIGSKEGRRKDPITVEAEAGLRRGIRQREFFRGGIDFSYRLAKQYITPASDLVKVDGMILERGVDYIITHTTGQLTFLNPDQVNALSLIEITYTYEQIPRKGTAGRSILEMLPWDNELGGFVRSGAPTYVTDESGLYKQIDGAAPKYIDRGWLESVYQTYEQGSTEVKTEIHDMGTPENALDIFDYDRPVSYVMLWENQDSIALLDESSSTSYAIKMWMDRFYVELTLDEKSRSAEILITLFAQAISTKGDLSGTLMDSLRPLIGHLRLGVNPSDNFGMGVGYLGSQDLYDQSVSNRLGVNPNRYQLATVDAWSDHSLGSGNYGGHLQTFVQAARGNSRFDNRDHQGTATSGNIIYNVWMGKPNRRTTRPWAAATLLWEPLPTTFGPTPHFHRCAGCRFKFWPITNSLISVRNCRTILRRLGSIKT
jgi:hypothetical protein